MLRAAFQMCCQYITKSTSTLHCEELPAASQPLHLTERERIKLLNFCTKSMNTCSPHAKVIDGFTPRDYLTHWLSQWVRDYGIDGFRVDTAKHVELPAWQQLKTEASAALREWKKANPDKALDDKPFWMTGEAWGHGVMQSDYYRHEIGRASCRERV